MPAAARGQQGVTINGDQVSSWREMNMSSGDGCTILCILLLEHTKMTELYMYSTSPLLKEGENKHSQYEGRSSKLRHVPSSNRIHKMLEFTCSRR